MSLQHSPASFPAPAPHADHTPWRRWCAGMALAFLGVSAAAPAETLRQGQFAAVLQEDKALLPGSIRWLPADVELLKPESGLNVSFTSFELRNKIYHEENRAIWGAREEPRFFTDVKVVGKAPRTDGDFSGIQVELESSYATYRRSLLFHRAEPRLRIEYAFAFTRDVVLHETGSLSIGFQFSEGFDQVAVPDGRAGPEAPPLAAATKGATHAVTLLDSGPKLLTHTAKKISLLMLSSHGGDGLATPPVRLLTLKKGQRLTLTSEWVLGAHDEPALPKRLLEARRNLPAACLPFLLVETARVLTRQGNLKEAEAALIQAGELSPEYAAPYGVLAALRRDHKLPGEGEAWVEAGYRMPYNYGYMLSGGGLCEGKNATEEQRRLHYFNLLIAVENNVFYPDYYLWAARGFLKMNMPAQACAMYRQALWAADFMPRAQVTRDKLKQEIQKQIGELETVMKTQTCTDLPALIPVRLPAGNRQAGP